MDELLNKDEKRIEKLKATSIEQEKLIEDLQRTNTDYIDLLYSKLNIEDKAEIDIKLKEIQGHQEKIISRYKLMSPESLDLTS